VAALWPTAAGHRGQQSAIPQNPYMVGSLLEFLQHQKWDLLHKNLTSSCKLSKLSGLTVSYMAECIYICIY